MTLDLVVTRYGKNRRDYNSPKPGDLPITPYCLYARDENGSEYLAVSWQYSRCEERNLNYIHAVTFYKDV